ncbi:FAD-dependent monooxygenase [Paenibacillus sp. MBLB4367]|uniref:FAD-dependent monooxygenase n=1 Tax=Paenibacillus sp. MBLB4367 TaxID=3384767 RepID=UPI0039082D4D
MRHSGVSGKKALIAGFGIGGLCAAIALQKAGWETVIFEKASERTEGGAGIVMAANAMKALGKLGAAERVRMEGMEVGMAEIRTWDGKLITKLPARKQAERYGSPSYLIHRAELRGILSDVLAPGTDVQFNKKLENWVQNKGKVTVTFADGTRAEGDLLIGADGLHSTVREGLFGHTPLRYSGYTALRGISVFRDERYPMAAGGGFEAWGPGKRFGFSHLGKGRIFWFAAINAPQGTMAPASERKRAALKHFRGWYDPIEAVIEATEGAAVLAHDIFDRKPASTWHDGCVALLGDAAHPMLPNLGQGGAQAIEDSLVLAACLEKHPSDIPAALLAYEQRRMARTNRIVRESRRMGRLVQLEHPAAIRMRNALLRAMPDRIQLGRLHWLLGYEV